MNTVASLPAKLKALADEVAALPAMSLTGSSVILPVPRAAEMVTTMREAAAALRSSGEAFGWYCARDKRFYRAGEWGNAACEHCTSLYTTPPSAPAAEQGDSRSRVRRIAIEKGEPAPRFDEQPEGEEAGRMAIRLLVAAGHVTEAKANEALCIAHGFEPGPLAPAAPVGVDAYEKGWINAAKWAQRVDLISDIGSAAYERDKTAALAGKEGAR